MRVDRRQRPNRGGPLRHHHRTCGRVIWTRSQGLQSQQNRISRGAIGNRQLVHYLSVRDRGWLRNVSVWAEKENLLSVAGRIDFSVSCITSSATNVGVSHSTYYPVPLESGYLSRVAKTAPYRNERSAS